MAWSFAQGTASSTLGVTQLTLTVTAGHLLVVGYNDTNSSSTLSISDGVNTWTSIDSFSDSTFNNNSKWWYAVAATTASITVTVSGSSNGEGMWFGEWSGNASGLCLDVNAKNTANNSSGGGSTSTDGDTTGQVTTTGADLVLSWIFNSQNGPDIFTAGTNFTKRTSLAGANIAAVEDLFQGGSGAVTGTWTASATDGYYGFTAAFKPAAGGVTVTAIPQLALLGVGR